MFTNVNGLTWIINKHDSGHDNIKAFLSPKLPKSAQKWILGVIFRGAAKEELVEIT